MAVIQIEDTINHSLFNTKKDLFVTLSVSAVGNSDWYQMPDGVRLIELELVPNGTAKVQATIDAPGASADTVDGVDWPDGEVSVRTQNVLNGNPLVRTVVTSGSADLILKGIKV